MCTQPTTKPRPSHGAIALVTALAAAGCGQRPHADTQAQGQVLPPSYTSTELPPFMLADQTGELAYKGNLLIFDPAVTAEQIRPGVDAAVNGRLQSVELLKYKQQLHIGALVKNRDQMAAWRAQADEAVANYRATYDDQPATVARKSQVMSAWFTGRLAELTAGPTPALSAEEAAAAQANFQTYCEAKIWELAVSPVLAKAYATRPTPLAMCESYYAARVDAQGLPDRLLDPQTPECQDAAPGEGKNYLDCIWRQGVAKTRMQRARPARDAVSSDVWWCDRQSKQKTKSEALAQLIATGTMQNMVREAYGDSTVMVKLSTSVLTGLPRVDESLLPKTGAATKDCPLLFFSQAASAVANLEQANIADLIGLVEAKVSVANKTNFKKSPTLLTPPTSRQGMATEGDEAKYELLAADIRAFASRNGNNTTPAVSDRDFNRPVGAPRWLPGVEQAKAVQTRPAFAAYQALATVAVPAKLLDEQAEATSAADAAAKALATANSDLDSRTSALYKVLGDGAAASTAPGVALVFAPMDLLISRQPEQLTVGVQLRSGRGALGCVSLGASQQPCQVQRRPDQAGWTGFKTLRFDAAANALQLDLDLDDPEAQQMAFSAGASEVSLLPATALRGKVLHLEAYANRLSGLLDFFTGKVAINSGEQVVYEGIILGDAFTADADRL